MVQKAFITNNQTLQDAAFTFVTKEIAPIQHLLFDRMQLQALRGSFKPKQSESVPPFMHIWLLKFNTQRSIGRVFRSLGTITTENSKNTPAIFKVHFSQDGDFKLTLSLAQDQQAKSPSF